MQVRLTGIKFNYDPKLEKTGAFNLRHNETQIVRIPEWQPDLPSTHKASPAAYAISTLPAEITIQASFACAGQLRTPLLIQAIAEPANHILGKIEPFEIPTSGTAGFVNIKLPYARLADFGIGIHDIAWRWQYSDQSGIWTNFQATYHRIYTVLALPSAPWAARSREVSNIHQPWTEVLDYACCWAAKVRSDPDEAATRITENFVQLGGSKLEYQEGGYYATARFACTAFLELLKGRTASKRVNCDDCATVISTFANILGCELSQSSFGTDFYINPVLYIGTHDLNDESLIHHAVAWKGDCVNDELFDGCLQIDVDLRSPFIPVKPVDVPFGTPAQGYRFSVVRDSAHVQPIPLHPSYGSRRRPLGIGYFAQLRVDPATVSQLKKIYGFDSWPRKDSEGAHEPFSTNLIDLFREASFIPDFESHSGEHFRDERFRNVFQFLLKGEGSAPGELLAVNVYECKDVTDASNNLIEILGRFERRLRRLSLRAVGNLSFSDGAGDIVVFRRRQILAVVRNAGRVQLPVIRFAELLDQRLLQTISSAPRIERREPMAHELGSLRHIYLLMPGNPPTFVAHGEIDVSRMEPNGNVATGTRRTAGSPSLTIPITGRVFTHHGTTYFTFTHLDRPGGFFGKVVQRSADSATVVGGFSSVTRVSFADLSREELEALLAQQEEPWVISKP